MLTQPFLTELDSRAAVKGSRDPLGVQSIWSRFGRHVVGNLTTVSNSVRDFTVLLLGYYFAERVAEEGRTESDLATFLKWEQLAAYARAHVNKERAFRGTERVWTRIGEGERVRIGTDSGCQILGNQKIYGLWGLYSVPARASGLLEADPARLTAPARELVERVYLPIFAEAGLRDARAIVERLLPDEYTLDLRERSKDVPVLEAVAKVLKRTRAREREVYREHLLYGGPEDGSSTRGTRGAQRAFAEVLAQTLDDPEWDLSPASIGELASRARGLGSAGEALAYQLERIRTCELLIAPAVAFFERVLGCDRQTPKEIADGVREQWGRAPRETIDLGATEALEADLRTWVDDAESSARWLRLARAFHAAQYEDALSLVLEQNAAVMKARSAAAPWAVVRDGMLQVRFRDAELSDLPEATELPEYWRHAYFIASLRDVALSLRG
jgi:hypothetical protein